MSDDVAGLGRRVRVLDLFAGLGGWSHPWREARQDVFAVDLDERFQVEAHLDVLQLAAADLPWRPDVVLASPPCEAFSPMTISRNWTAPGVPKSDKARLGLALLQRTLDLVRELDPAFWVVENPRGMMRKAPAMAGLDRRTVTYCQLGEVRQKPSDLWGGFPPSLVLPDPCRAGDPCHVSAPRGSKTPGSTQGIRDRADRAIVPAGLAKLVYQAAARDLAAGRTWREGPDPRPTAIQDPPTDEADQDRPKPAPPDAVPGQVAIW